MKPTLPIVIGGGKPDFVRKLAGLCAFQVLRTLQRKLQRWRGIVAKKLVYGSVDEAVAGPGAMPELALVGSDSKYPC
jgi:hypothetical protein